MKGYLKITALLTIWHHSPWEPCGRPEQQCMSRVGKNLHPASDRSNEGNMSHSC